MIFTIVIILIVVLIVIAIMINAVQQHKEKIESERRVEFAKQKTIVDETEDVIMASANVPTSPQLMSILQKRVHGGLKISSLTSSLSRSTQWVHLIFANRLR